MVITSARARAHPARRRQSGFTLVELAVVLAVIGLILGAVAIAKDVQRNAEYNKIKNKFIDQWEQAYNQYYQRVGVVVGDSQTQPRLMVNGENYTAASDSPTSGGSMRSVTSPGAVCDKAAPAAGQLGGTSFTLPGTTQATLRELMLRAGVRMPPGRAEGFEDRYVYLDTNGNPQEVQVCFLWQPPETRSGSGNVMLISGLTPDLARMLDQAIDGKPDEREGRFRRYGLTHGTSVAAANAPGQQWAANNQIQYGAATVDATSGRKLDEDQVVVVAAVLKMNQ